MSGVRRCDPIRSGSCMPSRRHVAQIMQIRENGRCDPFYARRDRCDATRYSMQAVRKCVERLWLVQQDFFKHVSGEPSPHPVLFSYQHMFKGIKVRFLSVVRCLCGSVAFLAGLCTFFVSPLFLKHFLVCFALSCRGVFGVLCCVFFICFSCFSG